MYEQAVRHSDKFKEASNLPVSTFGWGITSYSGNLLKQSFWDHFSSTDLNRESILEHSVQGQKYKNI